jgi:transcriptional regulator
MYVPKHFELPEARWRELLESAEVAEVVTAHPTGPEATLLPVSYVPDAAGGLGSLVLHVTRTNDLWRKEPLGDVLAILSGPDAYVRPDWFPGFDVDPTVPTWNYVTVHAYGELVVHDDPQWKLDVVRRVSDDHGFDLGLVDEENVALMLRAIVGVELRLTRVLAKAKLHQNKSTATIASVVAGLRQRAQGEDEAVADAMTEISLPHARAREELVAGIRAQHRAAQQAGPGEPAPQAGTAPDA